MQDLGAKAWWKRPTNKDRAFDVKGCICEAPLFPIQHLAPPKSPPVTKKEIRHFLHTVFLLLASLSFGFIFHFPQHSELKVANNQNNHSTQSKIHHNKNTFTTIKSFYVQGAHWRPAQNICSALIKYLNWTDSWCRAGHSRDGGGRMATTLSPQTSLSHEGVSEQTVPGWPNGLAEMCKARHSVA